MEAELRPMPAGILLHGGQGTGKTSFVHSMCKIFNMKIVPNRCQYQGFTPRTLNYLAETIHEDGKQHPVVLFHDEADGLLSPSSQSQATTAVANKLKTVLGNFRLHDAHVFLIGATNYPRRIQMKDIGRRFRLCVHVGLPCPESRKQILQTTLEKTWHTVKGDEWNDLAVAVEGYTPDDVASLVISEYMLLRRELRNATEWQKMIKNGEQVHVPAITSVDSIVKGSRVDFPKVSSRPITVEMLVLRLKTGRDGRPWRKTCTLAEHEDHAKWNEEVMQAN